MTLQDIIKNLDKVGQELQKVNAKQNSFNKAADGLAEKFKTTADSVTNMRGSLSNILPEGVLSKLDDMAKSAREQATNADKLKDSYSAHSSALEKLQAEYGKLQNAASVYSSLVNAATAAEIAEVDSVLNLQKQLEAEMLTHNNAAVAAIKQNISAATMYMSKMEIDTLNAANAITEAEKSTQSLEKAAKEAGKQVKDANKALKEAAKSSKMWGESIVLVDKALVELKSNPVWIVASGVTKSILNTMYEVGKATQEANGYLIDRLRLVSTNLRVSSQIGAATAKVAAAQKALLATGQKELATDAKRVKTVVMMAAGLGVAEEDAAMLALYADMTKNSFEDTANAVSILVRNTQMTGREAAKIAQAMAQTQRILGLSNGNLGDVTTAVGVMESALKKLGGTGDTATKLIDKFSTLKGLGAAVMFGGTDGLLSPEDFKDVNKIQNMLQSTGQKLQDMTGGDPMMLNALESTITRMLEGINLTEARALMAMSKPGEFAKIAKDIADANTLRKQTSDLEKSYRAQMTAAGTQWDMLKTQLGSLLKLALVPLLDWITLGMEAINVFLTSVGGFVAKIQEAKSGWESWVGTLAYGISLITSVAVGGALIKQIYTFGRAMLGLRATLLGASIIPGGGAGGAAGGMWAGMVKYLGSGSVIANLLKFIALPLAAIAGTIATVMAAVEGFKLIAAKMDQRAAEKNLSDMDKSVREKYGLGSDVDATEWLKQQNKARWDAEAAGTGLTPQATETPIDYDNYQNRAPAKQATSSELAYRIKDKEQRSDEFNMLAKEVKELRGAVTTGTDKQVKVAEKGTSLDLAYNRLRAENDALRVSPATVYGVYSPA